MRFIISDFLACLLFAASAGGQVRIPNRPSSPVFSGNQGKQRTELRYDPATSTVTIKLQIQDPNGYFIPNIRRENFAVYENGVRQNNVSVSVEHAAVSLGVLLEHGGRHPALNRELTDKISGAAHQLLESLGQRDEAAIWTYGDAVNVLADFNVDRQTEDRMILSLSRPDVSEANLYDALIIAIGRMRRVPERKAIVVISSGVDTFSKATYEDVLTAARRSDAPLYAVSLGQILQDSTKLHGLAPSGIDWNQCTKRLAEIARSSGGRIYSPDIVADLSSIYDDILENLKVRYVVTYQSSGSDSPAARTVRIALVDPATGKPLRIVDADGHEIRADVVAEQAYTPPPPATGLR